MEILQLRVPFEVLLSYFFGFSALVVSIISYQQKKRIHVLVWTILYNILFVLQYAAISLWDVAATTAIYTIFVIYCDWDERKAIKENRPIQTYSVSRTIIFAIFALMFLVSSIILWSGPWTLVQYVAITIGIFSVWQPNLKVFRYLSAICATIWIVYNWHYGVIFGAITGVMQLVSVLVAIYRFDIKGIKDPEAEKLNEQANEKV